MKFLVQPGHPLLLTDSTWENIDLSGIAQQLLMHFACDVPEDTSLVANDASSGYNAATAAG